MTTALPTDQIDTAAADTSVVERRALAAFRHTLRRFLAWSEQSARDAGLEPQQHQMMLAISGLPEGQLPTVGVLAERLQVRHHTAVELAGRLESNGLAKRSRTTGDHREVVISLTPEGETRLAPLVRETLRALEAMGPELVEALHKVTAQASHD
jgi:DNA-binding MarR family transcriptional regulator